jgi:hypothetical protein
LQRWLDESDANRGELAAARIEAEPARQTSFPPG